MNNTLIAGIYIPFAIITTVIFVMELLRRFKRQEDYLFMLLCLFSVCWFASNIVGLLTNRVETAIFCINVILIFVGFIPPVLFLFALKFYKTSYKLSIPILILLFTIPAINTALALTAEYHALINARLDIISLSPIREVIRTWGSWFWVHTAYCYIMSIILIVVIIFQHFKLPTFYRTPSTLMVSGIFLTLLGNVITLLQIVPPAMDPTLITMSLSLILFNLAIINNNKSKFVHFSRGRIYHYLEEYILILDETHRVADFNKSALDWFSAQDIPLNGSTLDDIMKALLQKGNKKSLEGENGVDIHYYGDAFPIVLNLHIHEVNDVKGDTIGSIAVFTNVTQNRMLIEKLEEKAGMDSLTGLANRTAYDGAKIRLDADEQIPLSVVMCDANGLKYVNDTFGHQYGDLMLRTIAEVLENACPDPGFIARIGGDEFIYLLPHTPQEAAVALTEQITTTLGKLENLPFPIAVAMGTATKHSADENLDDLIALADSRMYDHKKQMKKQIEISELSDSIFTAQ